MTMEGHDKACYYCGRSTNSFAGNPSQWPISLCHRDEPGVVKWHHSGCVSERLIENGGHTRALELQWQVVKLENFIKEHDLWEKYDG